MEFQNYNSPIMNQFRRLPEVVEVLTAIEGFNEAENVRKAAVELLEEIEFRRREQPPELDNEAILEVGSVPESWLSTIADRVTNTAVLDAQQQAAHALKVDAERKLDSIFRSGFDDALAALNDKLGALMADVRTAVEKIGHASNPREAIEAGSGREWAKIADYGKEYQRIRSGQLAIMTADGGMSIWQEAARNTSQASGRHYAHYGLIKNLDEAFPELTRSTASVPWPAEIDEFLVYVVRNNLDLWIPKSRELADWLEVRAQLFRDEFRKFVRLQQASGRDALIRAFHAGEVHPVTQIALREAGVL
ncbi:hypothetical protein [Nocardia lijiangensis]|uniref:hypothetical protein n=1 Tax=Nocardia lijiangensis TaxID=299618 RepID=UPI0008368D95|nr:hypothetical protein [Nocardia lijiangensis]